MTVTAGEVHRALADVRDPELDESIAALGFVSALEVDGDRVRLRLRLPTYFCAPNFAWLMVADARAALLALPGVSEATVTLDDHFAADEINRGVAAGGDFTGAFPALADGGLDELRRVFRRKAFLACQARLWRALLADGRPAAELARLRLGDLADSPEARAYRQRRAELGLDCTAAAPLLVDDAGRAVPVDAADAHLRRARTVAVSIDGNAGLCRGLLATRYSKEQP